MNLIRFAIERPIAVIAGVILVVMFGVIALQTIPIQLIPDVRKPIVEIRTTWPGAAPAEVEREIVNRQEEALRGLRGLESLQSTSEAGRGSITLNFQVGQNMGQTQTGGARFRRSLCQVGRKTRYSKAVPQNPIGAGSGPAQTTSPETASMTPTWHPQSGSSRYGGFRDHHFGSPEHPSSHSRRRKRT